MDRGGTNPTKRGLVSEQLKRTPLHEFHVNHDARLVDFAGWQLPIQYGGVVAEHHAVRSGAGLFDVSHMGVLSITGADVDTIAAALERVTPAGITTLGDGKMRYALLTNDTGGIVDDCMVTRLGDEFIVVVNAARRAVDIDHLRRHLGGLQVEERAPYALIALQGPQAASAMTAVGADVDGMFFLDATMLDIGPATCFVSRSGYTGEDGFEICVDAQAAMEFAEALTATGLVVPCGLGARDTLRLEAGLCLYGNDIDETTSPVEADLVWSMPKRRRDAGDFPGSDRITEELEAGPTRRRVGLAPQGRRPVRDGATLSEPGGDPIGTVSSGGFGPTLESPVAMGYVEPAHSTPGTELVADVRGSDVAVQVVPLPFTPHNYRRPPKK